MKVGDLAGLSGRSLPGRASAAVEVTLSFRVAGPLVAFPVQVGDAVKQDDLLAKIDPTDFRVELHSAEGQLARANAELEAMQTGARPEEIKQLQAAVEKAQAAFDRAASDFDRTAKLYKSNTASKGEYDAAVQERDRAQAELQQADQALRIGEKGAREEDIRAKQAEIKSLQAAVTRAANQLEYTDLKAPFDGKVTATYVENYEMVQAREPVLRVVDTSRIEFTVDVPERFISLVPEAKELVCVFREIPEREFPAEVKEIGIEPSPVTRTYPVTLIMDNPEGVILPGMTGDVRGKGSLPEDVAGEGYEVPESAILVDDADRRFVWIIDEQGMTVTRREVALGKPSPRGIRVKGLQQGEWIATAGVHYLHDGQKVRILSPPASPTPARTESTPAPKGEVGAGKS
jgi:multidrug efflux pump subunit AcrA (membrane-fusion protein)